MYKKITVGALACVLIISLAGCKNKEVKSIQDLKSLSSDTVIAEVSGKKITIGEVESKMYDRYGKGEINQIIQIELLKSKYPVTSEEIETEKKKLKETYSSQPGFTLPTDTEISYLVSYKKAARDGVKVTEEEIKEAYEMQYKESGKKFEEVKDEIEGMLYQTKGNDVAELIEKWKQEEVKFKNDSFKNILSIEKQTD